MTSDVAVAGPRETRLRDVKEGGLILGAQRRVTTIDCDVHPWVLPRDVVEFVPEPWRTRYYTNRMGDADQAILFYHPPVTMRMDAPGPGRAPGEDCEDMDVFHRQVLQEGGTDYAMILPAGRTKWWDPEWETAWCTGVNEYLARTWLGTHNWHDRYVGSIRVSPGDPEGAIREIRKWAGHPAIRQVIFAPETLTAPAGHPMYRPVFAEAAAHGLPIGMHIGRESSMQSMSPVGYASYHIEAMGSWPTYYYAHLASMIFEGVFDRNPDLRIVCIEGGFSWLAPLMWRLDRYWDELKAEIPEVRRRPSEYVADQVRLTTQPIEEPADPEELNRLIEWMGGQQTLMFSSDYPHWDYDDPNRVRSHLPESWRHRVMCANAQELYGLPETRPTDQLDLNADVLTRYHATPPIQWSSYDYSDARASHAAD